MRIAVTERYIDATQEAKNRLARLFKVSDKFVYMALTYRKNTDLARKVRYVAVRDYQGSRCTIALNARPCTTPPRTDAVSWFRTSTTVCS